MEMKAEINSMIDKIHCCEEEIGKGIIGQKDIVRQVMIAILSDGNILLEGVPGLGKTQLVKTISKVLQMDFKRIQFTPDLMPSDVTGTNLIVKKDGQNTFEFQRGPIFANMVLADEINRATPKTQAALLEAMQEKTVTVGQETYSLPKPFMVLATQNPIENEGTYPLPEAQLDRFLLKLKVEFPTMDELKDIVNLTLNPKEPEINPILNGDEILTIREQIKLMPVAEPVMDYALKLVVYTHKDAEGAPEIAKKYIDTGASPRAAQAIIKTAKARAFMEGRYTVSFEDVKYVAIPALRQSSITNFDALSDMVSVEEIIQKIMLESK